MNHGPSVSCIFCQRPEETRITGALSSKDQVTAHQNCLLFSSGIFCTNSPQFDDLFGFSVKDVLSEAKRGSKLVCRKCKRKGATAGCEVRRCTKSYHYPCAVEDGAQMLEDTDRGKYELYCLKHYQERQEKTSVNGCAASSSKQRRSREKTARNLSVERGTEPPAKRHCEDWDGMITDNSSDPDYNEPDADFGPVEFESDESQVRKETDCPTVSTSEGQPANEDVGEKEEDDDETDVESESLPKILSCSATNAEAPAALVVLPVVILRTLKVEDTMDEEPNPDLPVYSPPVLQQNFPGSPPSHDHPTPPVTPSPPCSGSAIPPAPLETIPSPAALPSEPETRVDSSDFWRGCNAAGCTQAIFAEFIDEMNNISSRIQSGQASREDHDLALTVMEASGKLAELVTKQQEDLKNKQVELQRAAVAMEEVVSALKR